MRQDDDSPVPRGPHGRILAGALLALLLGACGTPPPSEPEIREQNQTAKTAQIMRVADTTAQGGDLLTAASLYRRAAHMAPTDPVPLVKLGDTLAAARELREAVAAYRKALSLAPDNPHAHYGYGTVLLSMGRPELAVPELEFVYELQPKNTELLNRLGIALDLTGAHEKAQARYREALAVEDDNPSVLNNLGLSLALDQQFDEAFKVLTRLADDPIATPRHRLNLALAYGLAGRMDAAREAAARLLTPVQVNNNLAYYEKLRKMDPDDRAKAVFGIE
jgi:Flp pilus assembly protein TadD